MPLFHFISPCAIALSIMPSVTHSSAPSLNLGACCGICHQAHGITGVNVAISYCTINHSVFLEPFLLILSPPVLLHCLLSYLLPLSAASLFSLLSTSSQCIITCLIMHYHSNDYPVLQLSF
jgi:hypothetical protein